MSYFKKFKGLSAAVPPAPSLRQVGFIWLGAFLAATVLAYLAFISKQPLILGSFGASIFILFILPDSPFAQPRNVIGGHIVSSLVGLTFLHFVGPDWWSMALALATALSLMQLLKVPHPPAGSNPFIVFLAAANWEFLLMPTLVGAILLVIVALFYNNIPKDKTYPKYWW
ncbi:MAG: HPP family protein [Gammaproteobacteria bacterium]|nr:MAG: HPP family protein [Gammaproteobacteria bacterium]